MKNEIGRDSALRCPDAAARHPYLELNKKLWHCKI
jgi:hypothetical protein